jgi:hypothetical protein
VIVKLESSPKLANSGGLIEEAARRQASEDGRRVLFNCVAGYLLDAVAPSPAAALCLELWPPAVHYRDVVAWIDRAREVVQSSKPRPERLA